jgi:hypothetical protein
MSRKSADRFCEKDMLEQIDRGDGESKKSHPVLAALGFKAENPI